MHSTVDSPVPPESLDLPGANVQYRHVGALRFIDAAGRISTTVPLGTIANFLAELFRHPAHVAELYDAFCKATLTPFASFLDHMPKAYAIALRNDFDRNG